MAASMYTEATLITEARTMLREPTALRWTNDDITAAIRRGARILSGITLCVPIKEAVTTFADRIWNLLTAKFIRIESVQLLGGLTGNTTVKGLERLDLLKFQHGIAGGAADDTNRYPIAYWHFGNYLYLWPAPKGDAVGEVINVWGYRTASAFTYTSDTVYEIPDHLQPILLDYVLAECWTKAGKHSSSHLHFSRFIAEAGFNRTDVHDRELMTDSMDKTRIPDHTVSAER